jgi:hypothetical protein
MVVNYLSMSSVNFAIPDFCSLIPNVPALAANFQGALLWKRQNVLGMSGNIGAISVSLFAAYFRIANDFESSWRQARFPILIWVKRPRRRFWAALAHSECTGESESPTHFLYRLRTRRLQFTS